MEKIYIDEMSKSAIDIEYIKSLYDGNIFEISFFYKSQFFNSKFLRDYLILILEIIWINGVWVNRLVLMTDELNNNAIEYWSKEDDLNIMKVIFKKNSDCIDINIEVIDKWNWKEPKTAEEMEELRNKKTQIWFDNHNSIRWRGLFLIITKLVDELYFKNSSDKWLIVWINKKITAI